jgi:hypothetical protein
VIVNAELVDLEQVRISSADRAAYGLAGRLLKERVDLCAQLVCLGGGQNTQSQSLREKKVSRSCLRG